MAKRSKPPVPPTAAARPNPANPATPQLRLACVEPCADARTAASRETKAASYKFPGLPAVRDQRPNPWRKAERPERLVAARVDRAPIERRFIGTDSPCALVHDPDIDDPDRAGRIISSRDLVKQIESTLDRMQSRLEDFRTQVDEAFKFPAPQPQPPNDDDPRRPRAA